MIARRMAGRTAPGFVRSALASARRAAAERAAIGLGRRSRLEPLAGERPGIVVTGAGGTIGRVLREGLRDAYTLRTIDRRAGAGVDLVADVRRLDLLEPAIAGAVAVVELAADPRPDTPWDEVRENNLAATVATLEASRRAGVGRVVLASSNHVSGMYERDEPYASVLAGRYEGLDPATLPRIRADWPLRPDGFYAVGKCAAEAAGRFYAEQHGLSVLCLRIGTVNAVDRPRTSREYATLLTHRDLVQLVRRCLQAPAELRFGIFYGISANTWRIWSLEEATSALGYEPLDDAERFR
jgi:nucleoside-diphosphate-sugar epimerase